MKQSRIQIAKSDITSYFDNKTEKVFKLTDLAAILSEQRQFWRLAQRTTSGDFVDFLKHHSKLRTLDFPFPYRPERRYTWGEVPLVQTLLTVKPNSYFTHFTATRMHGLTEQSPKIIYINHEQRQHIQNRLLDQSRIDLAFSHAQRQSQNVIQIGDIKVCLINGMNTNQLNVIQLSVNYEGGGETTVRVTDIERTLIDITVRPAYAGGVAEVLKAFERAKNLVSINKLVATLRKLAYVYPYHQAIGFYLERTGYSPTLIDLLREIPIDFDFYLVHQMKSKQYIPQWRLYVPQGL